jgi:hypothetical protein
MARAFTLFLALLSLASCARVEVREATGAADEGVHYFMPRYYVQATRSGPKAPGAPAAPLYDVHIVTMPDPKQRRTIIQHPGFGSAQATGTLAEGWRLTQFGSETTGTDVSDLLSAAATAARVLIPPLAAQAAFGADSHPADPASGEEPITILLGIDMSPGRTRLFDEAVLIYANGRTEVRELP